MTVRNMVPLRVLFWCPSDLRGTVLPFFLSEGSHQKFTMLFQPKFFRIAQELLAVIAVGAYEVHALYVRPGKKIAIFYCRYYKMVCSILLIKHCLSLSTPFFS